MDQPQIIIVEDDIAIAELLAYNLREAGFSVRIFHDGLQLFQTLKSMPEKAPDLFILDLMLPGPDGYEICRKLRQSELFAWVPVLMLTARGSESDKVRGFESGADDYLTKPFGMRELEARVQALLRRYRQKSANHPLPAASDGPDQKTEEAAQSTGTDQMTQYRCRDILLDDVRHRVFKGGQEIDMTHKEYELLKFLMTNRGIAFSRDELLNRVWGFEYGGETRTVDVHIRQLRRKLDDDEEQSIIETVRGHGYRFIDRAL